MRRVLAIMAAAALVLVFSTALSAQSNRSPLQPPMLVVDVTGDENLGRAAGQPPASVRLAGRLHESWSLPSEATSEKGQVLATVSVNPDGTISDAAIVQPSSSTAINSAAQSALGRLDPTPLLREHYPSRRVQLNIAFYYNLASTPGRVARPDGWPPAGALPPGNGVTVPKVTREVKPKYTRLAMLAKVQGSVWIECVVQKDGTVGDAVVTQSLDRTFGLDQEALTAARQWQFTPGTRAGEPVPVIVTIELTFALRDDVPAAQTPAVASSDRQPADVQAIVADTQWLSRSDKSMRFVWWIPPAFWRSSMPGGTSREQVEQLVRILSPYTLIAVAQGEVGPLGIVTWTDEEAIRSRLTILDATAREYAPVASDQINADARTIAAVLKPVLSNLVGPMGQNMYFVYFPSLTPAGTPIVDPLVEGSFTVKMGGEVHRWRLPLGSLLPQKVCPVDGERLNGAWKYCPVHGKELVPGR